MQQLNEDQIDCLGELINVAYGKATARVADIMSAFATMRPPAIAVIDRDHFRALLQQACSASSSCELARQIFRGDVSGEVVFLLDERSAINIATYLKAQLGSDDSSDDEDVLLELSNIVTAAMMSELCAQMGAQFTLGEPELHRLSILPESQDTADSAFDHVIKVETVIEFAEQQIRGRIFILTHGHCFEWIRRSLDRVLDELPG
jgi:chemotaxis protein CheC